jgi:hypothetical protein
MGKAHFFGARGRLPPLKEFDFEFDFKDFGFYLLVFIFKEGVI